MQREVSPFPSYSAAERWADAAIHGAGIAFALTGGVWLALAVAWRADAPTTASVVVYCLGLAGMVGASAGYNLVPVGRAKAILRRVDHATIFVMIAGSYTPFAVGLMPPLLGLPLCLAVWGLAAAGIVLAVVHPAWLHRWGVVLYLAAGWLILPVIGPVAAALPATVLVLLVAGGLVYSAGTVVHFMVRMPFHNALWHALVLAAAALHFAAVTIAFAG